MVGQRLPRKDESGRFQDKRVSSVNNQDHIRVLSVDDHSVLNEGIAAFIGNQADMRLIAQANSGSDAIQKFRGTSPT